MYVYISYAVICIYMCSSVCRAQRLCSLITLHIFWTSLSLNLELNDWLSRMADELMETAYFTLPPALDYRCVPPSHSYGCWGSEHMFSCCVVGTLPNEPSPHFQEEDILVNNTHGYELGSIRIKHRKKIVESHCWEERLREISRNEPWFAFLSRYFHRGRKHFKNVACLYSLY